MTKKELQDLIRAEVVTAVKQELPRLVKPLVQEAVAGALANLLAEGIVRGAPPAPKPSQAKVLTPNVPVSRPLNSSARAQLAQKMGYGRMDSIGESYETPSFGNVSSPVNNILAETAAEMHQGVQVPSVLDSVDELGEVSPDTVGAISRDYSDLMAALNRRGKMNG